MFFFHPTWIHWTSGGATLFLLSLLHEGLRTRLSDMIVKRFVNAWCAFWGVERKSRPKPAIPQIQPDDECVKMGVFKEHKDGDARILSSILAGLDQNSRVVSAAAIDISDRAKEIRENFELIRLSQGEQRREFDGKMGDIHEKVNATNVAVGNLAGQVAVVIKLAQDGLQKKTGT